MQIAENLRQIYEEERERCFCFDGCGKVLWLNALARNFWGEKAVAKIDEIFPWIDLSAFPAAKNFSVKSPVSSLERLDITSFGKEPPVYVAAFPQLAREDLLGNFLPADRLNQEIRHRITDIFILLDALAEKIDDGDEQASAQLYSVQRNCLMILKTVCNQEVYNKIMSKRDIAFSEIDAGAFFRELVYQASLLTAGGPLKIHSQIDLDNVLTQFDTELAEIAILNFISISLANSRKNGEGNFELDVCCKNDWIQVSISDDVSDDLPKGEIISFGDEESNGTSVPYPSLALEIVYGLVSFYGGQAILSGKERGYKLIFTLPAREEDSAVHSDPGYIYRQCGRQSRFSLPEIILSDRGHELPFGEK